MNTLAFPTGLIVAEQWISVVAQLPGAVMTEEVNRLSQTAMELADALEGVSAASFLVSQLRAGGYQEAVGTLLRMKGTEGVAEISGHIPQSLQESLAAERDRLRGLFVMRGQEEQDSGAVYLLGAELLAREIERFQASFPREGEIGVILHAVGDAFCESNCPWGEGAGEEFRLRLLSLDDESLHYLRELAMVPPLHYLLVLDRLGLLPTEGVRMMPVGYGTLKQKRPHPSKRESAVGNLVNSLQTLFGLNNATVFLRSYERTFGMGLEIQTMGRKMDQIPAGVVRAISCLTCYPLGHLHVAERLGLIELPEILKP